MVCTLKAGEIPVIKDLLEETIADLSANGGFKFKSSSALLTEFVKSVTARNMMVMTDDRVSPNGFLVCNMIPSYTTDDIWAAVLFFYVKPDARQKGIGKALLSNLITVAGAIGATRVSIAAPNGETAPGKVYKKLNFSEIEVAYCLKL